MSASKPVIRIALIDDDALDRMLLQRPIGKYLAECEFHEASNPADALTLMTAHPFNLAFIDVNLGPHDGFALGQSICDMALAAAPKIIFLSGHVRPEDMARAKDISSYPIMKKPMAGAESELFGQTVADIING